MRGWMIGVYTALALGANVAGAGLVAAQDLAALATGDMAKLILHASPQPVPDAVLVDGADVAQPLSQWRGQWVVLNFWATWCAPCRTEMPSLDRLAEAMPGVAVLPVATGRNSVVGIAKFFEEADITRLPTLRDPTSEFSRGMAVLGLPVTVILDPQGREVARLIGDAEWDSPDALAVLTALMATSP